MFLRIELFLIGKTALLSLIKEREETMKKLITLTLVFAVVLFISPVFGAVPTTSTTQNNTNSATSDNNSTATSTNSSDNSSTNNTTGSSTNDNANSGVNLVNTSIESSITPPSTFPMVGTVSGQLTTPFGGAGFSKDARYSKLMTTIQFINYMKETNLLEEDKAKEDALKVYNKLLINVCGRSCVAKKKAKENNFSKDYNREVRAEDYNIEADDSERDITASIIQQIENSK